MPRARKVEARGSAREQNVEAREREQNIENTQRASKAYLLGAALLLSAACGDGGLDATDELGRFAIAHRSESAGTQNTGGESRRAEPLDPASADAGDAPDVEARGSAGEQNDDQNDDDTPSASQGNGEDGDADEAVVEARGSAREQNAAADAGAAPASSTSPVTELTIANETSAADSTQDEDAGLLLIDSQIAAVTAVANAGEIARARLALGRLKDPALRAFASELLAQHELAQARQAALLQAKRLTPKANTVSSELGGDSDAALGALQAEGDGSIDATYLATLSTLHEKLLAILDRVLMPSACDGELKAELKVYREAISAQLARARELKAALGC